jgi:hypothetical protein
MNVASNVALSRQSIILPMQDMHASLDSYYMGNVLVPYYREFDIT